MNIDEARIILADEIMPEGGLFSLGWYLSWKVGKEDAVLDGQFTADQLEAIALVMRAHKAGVTLDGGAAHD